MTAIEFMLFLSLIISMILNVVFSRLYGKTVNRIIKMQHDHANEVARLKFLNSIGGHSNDRD